MKAVFRANLDWFRPKFRPSPGPEFRYDGYASDFRYSGSWYRFRSRSWLRPWHRSKSNYWFWSGVNFRSRSEILIKK